MFRNRFALVTATAAGSLLGLATLTSGAQASEFDTSLSHSVNCSNLAVNLTATNVGANPFEVYFQLDTSAGTTVTSGVVVMGNSSETRFITRSGAVAGYRSRTRRPTSNSRSALNDVSLTCMARMLSANFFKSGLPWCRRIIRDLLHWH